MSSIRRPKSTSTPLHLSLLLLLLLLLSPLLSLSSDSPQPSDDLELEELLAIDAEEDRPQSPTSEARVLSKAQRIVVELNNDNTNTLIDQNEFVLLMGYTPWCPRSAELMPQFAEAANLLSELGSSVVMAKVDCERYPRMAGFLEIKGYPTLLLFTNGTAQPYTGGFSAEDIVIWARKKTGEPVVRLNSVADADAFVNKYSMFVVGLFDRFEGPQYEEFVKAAVANNEIQFVETSSYEVAKLLFPEIKPGKPFLGLVKNEPERYAMFEEHFEMDKILQFLEDNKFPLVTTLSELNSIQVYSSQIKYQLYVFGESYKVGSLLAPLQEVAKKFKSKILFIYVDITDDNLAKPLLTLLGLEESKDTVVAAFDNKISSKYLLEAEPTPDKIEYFCSGILSGAVPTYFKSQAVPDNENATVLTVVGKAFDELVLRSPKSILLEVHTPWCMNCETTSKQVEKLAKHFKGLDNLVFARIDASANEHPQLLVSDYPSLLFYPAADKSNPIKLSTKSNLKELAAFIKKNVKAEEHAVKDEL